MDLAELFKDLFNKCYTDVYLSLVDNHEIININVHKTVLANACNYFNKLFNFQDNKNKSHFYIRTNNSKIANDIILSFYGKKINYSKSEDLLEYFKCRAFFCLDYDIKELYDLKISPSRFDYLVQSMDQLNLTNDVNILKMVKKNIPTDYDLSRLSKEFVDELALISIE